MAKAEVEGEGSEWLVLVPITQSTRHFICFISVLPAIPVHEESLSCPLYHGAKELGRNEVRSCSEEVMGMRLCPGPFESKYCTVNESALQMIVLPT